MQKDYAELQDLLQEMHCHFQAHTKARRGMYTAEVTGQQLSVWNLGSLTHKMRELD